MDQDYSTKIAEGCVPFGSLMLQGVDVNAYVLERIIARLDQGRQDVNELVNGFAAIHTALTAKAPLDFIKQLVERGADVNRGDKDKNTPLHYCVFPLIQHPAARELILYLVSQEADVYIKNTEGQTPLEYARDTAEHDNDEGRAWGRMCVIYLEEVEKA